MAMRSLARPQAVDSRLPASAVNSCISGSLFPTTVKSTAERLSCFCASDSPRAFHPLAAASHHARWNATPQQPQRMCAGLYVAPTRTDMMQSVSNTCNLLLVSPLSTNCTSTWATSQVTPREPITLVWASRYTGAVIRGPWCAMQRGRLAADHSVRRWAERLSSRNSGLCGTAANSSFISDCMVLRANQDPSMLTTWRQRSTYFLR